MAIIKPVVKPVVKSVTRSVIDSGAPVTDNRLITSGGNVFKTSAGETFIVAS